MGFTILYYIFLPPHYLNIVVENLVLTVSKLYPNLTPPRILLCMRTALAYHLATGIGGNLGVQTPVEVITSIDVEAISVSVVPPRSRVLTG